jgi:hypothetical protein
MWLALKMIYPGGFWAKKLFGRATEYLSWRSCIDKFYWDAFGIGDPNLKPVAKF